jgi:RNA polymerase-binding transcription factor
MAQRPRDQQSTDAKRIGDLGTGKTDKRGSPERRSAPRGSTQSAPRARRDQAPPPEDLRARLQAELDVAVEKLRELGISTEAAERPARVGAGSPLDEGDQAQASEREDINVALRQRLADRITRLTSARQRLDEGTYGRCSVCEGPIEPARLVALPEAETCVPCQEQLERSGGERAA